jgi:hypothetical protein
VSAVRKSARFLYARPFIIATECRSKHLSTSVHLWSVHKTISVVCLALSSLASCSRHEPLSRDELQSKLRSAESVAAEVGTFINYVRQNRATDQYAKGHIEYLSSDLVRTAKELREAFPPTDAERQLTDGRKQVEALGAELSKLRSSIGHPDEPPANRIGLPRFETRSSRRFLLYEEGTGHHAWNHDRSGRLR